MGWAERLNPNSERNIEKFNNSAARAKHRERNEEREQEAASGDAAAHRSPLYAYGRAVLRSAKARRRAEKIAAAAAKLEASVKRAKEAEDAGRKILVVEDDAASDLNGPFGPGGAT